MKGSDEIYDDRAYGITDHRPFPPLSHHGAVAGVTAGLAAGGLAAQHHAAHAQPAQAANPFGREWWPSTWGPTGERGAANRVTPAKVLEAAKLIKTGKIYQLGRLYEQGMPLFGSRHYSLTIPGGPTGGPFGTAKLVYNDEMVSGEIGQVGTQFDGLGHVGTLIGNEVVYYNGLKQSEVGGAYGLQKLGIHNVDVFFTQQHQGRFAARHREVDAPQDVASRHPGLQVAEAAKRRLAAFLDGLPGLLHISIGCMNSYLKYAKLMELRRSDGG